MHRPILLPVAVAVAGGIRKELQDGWAINDVGMLVNLRQAPGEIGDEDPNAEVVDAQALERDVDVTRLDDVIRAESSKEGFLGMITGGGNIHDYARRYTQVMTKKSFISNYLVHRVAMLVNRLMNNNDLMAVVDISEWKEENRREFVDACSRARTGYTRELVDLMGEMHREIWGAFDDAGLRKDGFGVRASVDMLDEEEEKGNGEAH